MMRARLLNRMGIIITFQEADEEESGFLKGRFSYVAKSVWSINSV